MSNEKDIYSQLGVSSKKEDVHEAIKFIDQGLFPGSFCKIVPDSSRSDDWCSIFHSDGAGTKYILSYSKRRNCNEYRRYVMRWSNGKFLYI